MTEYTYFLNRTDHYHIHDLKTLGWELTVCNALWNPSSPCRKILKTDAAFGVHLDGFLRTLFPVDTVRRVLEVGGGTGVLMRDLLNIHPLWSATMLDISPYLLGRQKESLAGSNAEFLCADFLAAETDDLQKFDCALLNENLGDFPTLVSLPKDAAPEDLEAAPASALNQAEYFRASYGLQFLPGEPINIGALMTVDKLCRAGVPLIYLSEHSCEARAPEAFAAYLKIFPTGIPERISLKGHAEYTIKFSHLQNIAQIRGYQVIRGPLADFLVLDLTPKALLALRMAVPATDEQEILQQFIYDLYKYEYLVLIRR